MIHAPLLCGFRPEINPHPIGHEPPRYLTQRNAGSNTKIYGRGGPSAQHTYRRNFAISLRTIVVALFVANPPPHEDVLEISHCHIFQQEYEPLAIFSSSFAILDGNGPEQQASPFVLQALALSIGTIPQETAFHHVARVQWKQQWHQYAGSS